MIKLKGKNIQHYLSYDKVISFYIVIFYIVIINSWNTYLQQIDNCTIKVLKHMKYFG